MKAVAKKKPKHKMKQPMRDLEKLPKGEAQKPFTPKGKKKSKDESDY